MKVHKSIKFVWVLPHHCACDRIAVTSGTMHKENEHSFFMQCVVWPLCARSALYDTNGRQYHRRLRVHPAVVGLMWYHLAYSWLAYPRDCIAMGPLGDSAVISTDACMNITRAWVVLS